MSDPQGLGVALDTFNATSFAAVKTSKLRLEVLPQQDRPAGILEWKVFNYGPVPALPPVVDAGVDRSVVSNGQTYLSGKVTWLEDSTKNRARWIKTAGPGAVVFVDAASPITTATFSQAGDYVLALDARGAKARCTRLTCMWNRRPLPIGSTWFTRASTRSTARSGTSVRRLSS